MLLNSVCVYLVQYKSTVQFSMFIFTSSEVYMQDLESGLSFMLNHEVATKPIIQGGELSALRNFVGMLAQVIVMNVKTEAF